MTFCNQSRENKESEGTAFLILRSSLEDALGQPLCNAEKRCSPSPVYVVKRPLENTKNLFGRQLTASRRSGGANSGGMEGVGSVDGSWSAVEGATEALCFEDWCSFKPVLFMQKRPHIRHLMMSGSCVEIRRDCASSAECC